MRSGGDRGVSARAGLVRVLAVLAVLIGLALLQSSPCLDQAGTANAALHSGMHGASGADTDAGLPPSGADLLAVGGGALDVDWPAADFDVPVDVAALCVAVLIAALLLIAGTYGPVVFRPAHSRAAPDIPAGRRPRRAYSLAMLCVLRT
ncbi:hypothetical protein [Nocardia sp. NPDC057668]|uniref:hypothetical protein n=1 Tax=Nocardia sp. NPDC057668 TaxID=3346202 RepID=UPI00366D31FC